MANRAHTREEQDLFDDIREGKTFDRDDELPPLYEKMLKKLLWMQGDSEYSGALGYMPWIEKAPTLQEKVLVAQIVKDEMRHASVIYRLLREVGEETEEHVRSHELGFKLEEDDIQIGFRRLKDDNRVNIFYYGINHWTDFILFNFLMDRAAGHQLEDTLQSSYTPWKKGIEGIYKEEIMHLTHGDKWVKILAERSQAEGVSPKEARRLVAPGYERLRQRPRLLQRHLCEARPQEKDECRGEGGFCHRDREAQPGSRSQGARLFRRGSTPVAYGRSGFEKCPRRRGGNHGDRHC